MAMRTRQLHCETCGQPRPFDKPAPNHVLHLLLSCLTLGLWVIMWIFVGIADSPKEYNCRTCGWKPPSLGKSRLVGALAILVLSACGGYLFWNIWTVQRAISGAFRPETALATMSTEAPRRETSVPAEETPSTSSGSGAESPSSEKLANLFKAIARCEPSMVYFNDPEVQARQTINKQSVAYAVDQELRERSWKARSVKARILKYEEPSGLIWYRDSYLGYTDQPVVCTEPFPEMEGTSQKCERVALERVPDGPFALLVQVEWGDSPDARVFARLSDRRKAELKAALEAAARSALEDLPFAETLLCQVRLWNTETQRFD